MTASQSDARSLDGARRAVDRHGWDGLTLRRLADGSLEVADPRRPRRSRSTSSGTTYRHLRSGHGWSAKRARAGVVELALRGVVAR